MAGRNDAKRQEQGEMLLLLSISFFLYIYINGQRATVAKCDAENSSLTTEKKKQDGRNRRRETLNRL